MDSRAAPSVRPVSSAVVGNRRIGFHNRLQNKMQCTVFCVPFQKVDVLISPFNSHTKY